MKAAVERPLQVLEGRRETAVKALETSRSRRTNESTGRNRNQMTSRNKLSRISRLEGAVIPPPSKTHSMIGDSTEECELQGRALINCGKAEESDLFIFRIIVSPEPRTDILSFSAQEGDRANEIH